MESRGLESRRLGLWLLDISLISAVCLLLFFRGIGVKPFYDKAEAREALVIWEIHNSGNWILPLRNGEEIPAKPPFYHWLGALASSIVGRVDELTSRLPSAVLGTIGVLLTYAAGVLLWGRGAGLLAALVLVGALYLLSQLPTLPWPLPFEPPPEGEREIELRDPAGVVRRQRERHGHIDAGQSRRLTLNGDLKRGDLHLQPGHGRMERKRPHCGCQYGACQRRLRSTAGADTARCAYCDVGV